MVSHEGEHCMLQVQWPVAESLSSLAVVGMLFGSYCE